MEIKLLKNRILIEPIKEKVTKSGILLFEDESQRALFGRVVHKGEGSFNNNGEREKMDCDVGDLVFHSKYSGVPLRLNGINYLIMTSDDIICVVPNADIDLVVNIPKGYEESS